MTVSHQSQAQPGGQDAALTFRARHRLGHAREFQAVYDAKARKARGPLIVFSLPNDLEHPRLGLSVSGRVGGAVARNRIKRLLREAFRLQQHGLPRLDLVVQVRPHTSLPLSAYMQLLLELAIECGQEWNRRGKPGSTT